ncbi:DUF2130 domain-containing protein [Patescibacteria group bacterium AH-259-L07]|nr:DUF2130 domain-containing protein [Patescibacteria group bacterium AH-259-L07]
MSDNQTDKIKCPECNALIPITETLQHQLTESVRKEYEEKLAEQKHSLSEQQKELVQKEKALEEKEKSIDERVQQSVKIEIEAQKKILAQKARKQVEEDLALEMRDLKDDLKVKEEKLEEAKKTELQLRKRERELEARAKDIELEVARKIDQERKKVEDEVAKRILDERRMKDAEKDKQISDMRRQIEDLKRRAEQGSQQAQGEIQELELEKELSQLFPVDNVQPVPKGMQGADVIQEVLTNSGRRCGAIIWESKRTKNWSDGWISKLKDDQRSAKADVAIIVTQVLPKDIRNFGFVNGIWVTNYASFHGLAVAIRQKITELAFTKVMAASKDKRADVLFHYLTGPEFRQRIEAIIEAFSDMKIELDKEKRLYERSWAKREKQLQSVLLNTAGMYGDLQGVIGSSMQTIPALEAGSEEEEEVDNDKKDTAEKAKRKSKKQNEEKTEDIPF